jgi:hypothetical protein
MLFFKPKYRFTRRIIVTDDIQIIALKEVYEDLNGMFKGLRYEEVDEYDDPFTGCHAYNIHAAIMTHAFVSYTNLGGYLGKKICKRFFDWVIKDKIKEVTEILNKRDGTE